MFPTISRCFSYYGRPTHARSKYSSVWLMSRCWGSTTEASRTSPTRVLVSDHILFLQMITITQMLLAVDSNRETPTATRTLRLAISTGADTGFPERGGGVKTFTSAHPLDIVRMTSSALPKSDPRRGYRISWGGGGEGIVRVTSSALQKVEKTPTLGQSQAPPLGHYPRDVTHPYSWQFPSAPPPPGRTQEGGCRDMPNRLTSQTSARLS